MIGIKGVAKKPITDATANPENVLASKIFYNNNGYQVGTLSKNSVESILKVTVPAGSYNERIYLADNEWFSKLTVPSNTLYLSHTMDTYGTDTVENISRNFSASGSICLYDNLYVNLSGDYNYMAKLLYLDLSAYNISEIRGIKWMNLNTNTPREFRLTFGLPTSVMDFKTDPNNVTLTVNYLRHEYGNEYIEGTGDYTDCGPRVIVSQSALIIGVSTNRTSCRALSAKVKTDLTFEISYI